MEHEGYKPTLDQVNDLKMRWQKVRELSRPTEQQVMLDDVAAYFMLSPFGRINWIFEGRDPLLNPERFSSLDASQENHLYLARIASHLLDSEDPHIMEIAQLIRLISDFDLPNNYRKNAEHPYIDKYEGIDKFSHPDFEPLRQSIGRYLKDKMQNNTGEFAQRVNRATIERGKRLGRPNLSIENDLGLMKRVIERGNLET